MAQKSRCIYRKKKCFNICNKTTIKNTYYCCHHIHSKKKHLCKIFYKIFEENAELKFDDIYKIYKYILENTPKNDDIFINILFIDLLKMINIDNLSNNYKKYIIIPYNIKSNNTLHVDLFNKIYLLNKNTYTFSKKCNINILIQFQNTVKYKLLCNSNSSNSNYLNDEDIFTMVNICDIHPRNLFTINDIKGAYAFDIVELEYFVRKCLCDNIIPYNPYTREIFNEKIIWRLNMKIKYNNIVKKTDDCRWTTDMNAYTDLSIEIERRGFYNNPEWFKKMSKKDFLKCIKLFRDFSNNIEESKQYFLNIQDDAFIFDFCKEGIKLFRECNDDLYILCCNFMKSIALCSNDFYNNIPEWLSISETTSYISSFSHFTSLISTLNNLNNLNNIEYDYSNVNGVINNNNNLENLSIGDELLNNRINNIISTNDQSNILNTNFDNDINNTNITVNPSNNFLLYYYVEYM